MPSFASTFSSRTFASADGPAAIAFRSAGFRGAAQVFQILRRLLARVEGVVVEVGDEGGELLVIDGRRRRLQPVAQERQRVGRRRPQGAKSPVCLAGIVAAEVGPQRIHLLAGQLQVLRQRLLVVLQIPDDRRAVLTRGQHSRSVGTEGETVDLPLEAAELPRLLAGGSLDEANRFVAARHGHQLRVGGESEAVNRLLRLELPQFLARGRIPEAHHLVLSAAGKCLAVGGEGDALHPLVVSLIRSRTRPVAMSHSCTLLSALPVASCLPSGETATAVTAPVWPCAIIIILPDAASRTQTELSSLPTARRPPSGERAAEVMAPRPTCDFQTTLPVATSHA